MHVRDVNLGVGGGGGDGPLPLLYEPEASERGEPRPSSQRNP